MNKVFLSGKIVGNPELRMESNDSAHLSLVMSVRHRTRSGETHQELYHVNAWNNAARWGAENLTKGQIVAVQGYLTQRQIQAGGITATATEVTAEEFLPMQSSRQENAAQDDVTAA